MEHSDKLITQHIILKIPAGQATAKAPLGPTLGQCGVPIADFCTKFNKESSHFFDGVIVKCELTTYEDDTYSITLHRPDIIEFIKQSLEIEKLTPTTSISVMEDSTYSLIITTGMLVEILENYLGEQVKEKVFEYWFKRLVSQLRSFGILVIATE